MRWFVIDARRRNIAVVAVAVVVTLALGWTAWSGLKAKEAGTLRPIRYGDSVRQTVALTFDVTGGSAQTTAILAELKACRAVATFFVTARWADENHALISEMVAAGHTVEASGRDYADMTRLSREAAADDLRLVADAIRAAGGVGPAFFRPPGGKCSDRLLEGALSCGLIPVTWTIDSRDWRAGAATAIAKRVAAYARPGAIVLLHAGDEAAGTAPALEEMVALLRKAGLEPVTLRVLLADEGGN